MAHAGGRPKKFTNVEELAHLIDLYFLAIKVHKTGNTDMMEGLSEDDLLIINDIEDNIPTVSGLAYSLDMTTASLRNYGNDEEFFSTINKAKQRIEMSLEQRLAGTSPTGTIFNLKNNFGWKDKNETEHTIKDEDLKNRTTDELMYFQKHGKFPTAD